MLLVCARVCVSADPNIDTSNTLEMMANVMHCSANGSGPLGRMDSLASGCWKGNGFIMMGLQVDCAILGG